MNPKQQNWNVNDNYIEHNNDGIENNNLTQSAMSNEMLLGLVPTSTDNRRWNRSKQAHKQKPLVLKHFVTSPMDSLSPCHRHSALLPP